MPSMSYYGYVYFPGGLILHYYNLMLQHFEKLKIKKFKLGVTWP